MTSKINLRHYDVIRRPIVSEKSTNITENKQYTFEVDMTATKPEIKAAVEAIFEVKVEAVNTLIRKGKTRVFRGRRGFTKNTKRAIVTIHADSRIDVTSGV